MKQRITVFAIVFALCALVFATYFVLLRDKQVSNAKVTFSSDAWIINDDHRFRGTMVEDLIASRILEGVTRNRVYELLGTPDSETVDYMSYKVDVGDRFGSTIWNYELKLNFSEGIVSNVLLLD